MGNKQIINNSQKYPPKDFKNLSAEDILMWLEQSSQFVRAFLSKKDFIKWREIKNETTSYRF